MKRVLFALALAVVLTLAIAAPVMAKGVVEVPAKCHAAIGVEAANARTAETPAPLLVCLP